MLRSNLFGELDEVQPLVLEHIISLLYTNDVYTLLLSHTQAAHSVLSYIRNQSLILTPTPLTGIPDNQLP